MLTNRFWQIFYTNGHFEKYSSNHKCIIILFLNFINKKKNFIQTTNIRQPVKLYFTLFKRTLNSVMPLVGGLGGIWSFSYGAAEKYNEKVEAKCTGFSLEFFGSQSAEMFSFARKSKNSNVDNFFLELDKNPSMSS